MNMGPIRRSIVVGLTGLLGLISLQGASAQEPVVDPPGRVARLSLKDGEVLLAPTASEAGDPASSGTSTEAGTEEWAEAVLNRPLTSGDRLWVGADGRAELQVGTATLHLDRSTGFEFIELDDDVMQMSLTQGLASIRVRTLGERETVQVETPHATVHLRRPGEYTVQVDPESDHTIVRTRNGEADVTGASKSFRVRADQEGVFTGLDGLTANFGPLSRRTAFEAWANDRDRRSEQSESSRYVAREVIGYEDLDSHGEWIEEPEYGHVWRPRHVVHDWAPYRYGRWAWVAPWGWTWIDDAPWGFAPFHYGRWAVVRHRWCWVPGPRHLRPYYAPALVGWVGGPAVNVSVSFGHGVGWFPLAPHEVYVPWYRHTPRYVRHVNVSNTIIVNNIHVTNIHSGRARPHYRHRNVADAVTAVQRDLFVGGRSVGVHRIRVHERELHQWRDNVRPTAIRPERRSVLAAEPRRAPPLSRASLQDRPKRGGDFRTPRQSVTSGEIKRADRLRPDRERRAGSARDQVALGDPARSSSPSRERLHTLRGESRSRDDSSRTQRSPRVRDEIERSSARTLRSEPSVRTREQPRPSERFERSRPERNLQPQIREQPRREAREQPRVREWSQEVRPRHAAPVERQSRAGIRSHSEPHSRTPQNTPSRAAPLQHDRGAGAARVERSTHRPGSRDQR